MRKKQDRIDHWITIKPGQPFIIHLLIGGKPAAMMSSEQPPIDWDAGTWDWLLHTLQEHGLEYRFERLKRFLLRPIWQQWGQEPCQEILTIEE